MARYINANMLVQDIERNRANNDLNNAIASQTHNAAHRHFIKMVLDQPTADVVPREEVKRIFNEIEQEIVAALESDYKALRTYDDGRNNDYILELVGRVKGKIDALRGIEDFIEELKKKYTKGGEQG